MPNHSVSGETEEAISVVVGGSIHTVAGPDTPAELATEHLEDPNPGSTADVPEPPFIPVTTVERNTSKAEDGDDVLASASCSRSASPSNLPQEHRIEDDTRDESKRPKKSKAKRAEIKSWMHSRHAKRVGGSSHPPSPPHLSGNPPIPSTSSGSSTIDSGSSTDTEVRSVLNHIEKSGENMTGLVRAFVDLAARVEKLEGPDSKKDPKSKKQKKDSSSSAESNALYSETDEAKVSKGKRVDKPSSRTFELIAMFVCDGDSEQRRRFFDFETYYPFMRVQWDEPETDLSNPMTENRDMTIMSTSATILQICMESPVIQSCFGALSDAAIYGDDPPPKRPAPVESTPPDGTIAFKRPFRWLIEHQDLIRDKVKALQEERMLSRHDDARMGDSHDPDLSHNEMPVSESSELTHELQKRKSSISQVRIGHHSPDHTAEVSSNASILEHDLLAQLQYLLSFMEEYMSAQLQVYRYARAGKLETIQYKDLWMLFKAKDLIYTPIRPLSYDRPTGMPGPPGAMPGGPPGRRPGAPPLRERPSSDSPQAYRVVAVVGGRPTARVLRGEWKRMRNAYSPLEIMTYYVDFDGVYYGVMHTVHTIMPFVGKKEIRSLAVYPLIYAPNPEISATFGGAPNAPGEAHVLEFLRKRGHEFLQVSEASHRFYEGLTIGQTKEEISTPVIIDFKLAYRYIPSLFPRFSLPDWQDIVERIFKLQENIEAVTNYKQFTSGVKVANPNWYHSHQYSLSDKARSDLGDLLNSFPPMSLETPETVVEKIAEMMEKNGLIYLLPGAVHAFALRTRKWVSLDLSLVQPANEQAGWDDLILPPGHKDMVRAVVETHTAGSRSTTAHVRRATEVDIVRGKGKGCIILLHGEPGVGKTSTAECVAAFTKRPLFSITCGDIGYEPTDVEKNIDAHFSLAQKWGCVVLLDEADVFLAKRNREDVKRNGLVSVFLRTLEYYQGILFLTTNRVGSIDDAFRSRLHLTLYYPKLGYDQTMAIFDVNLRRLDDLNNKRLEYGQEPIDIHRRKILEFAERHWEKLSWNGRQIRNAFQTAVALAEFEANKDKEDAATASVAANSDGEKTKERPPVQPVMSTKQFRTIAKASIEFDDYLFLTHGNNDMATNARRDHYRTDNYEFRDGGRTQQQQQQQQQQRRRSKRHGASHRLFSGSSSSSSGSSSSSDTDAGGISRSAESDGASDSDSSSSEDDKKKRKKKKSGSSRKDKVKSKKKDDKGKKHKPKKEKH
ncbi:aaa family atpase protein [Apiospora arundinis]|uniref:Aaa family atpase protein n=1 Tax=Apiospora arundinis TaxID=335852 RepID=A0ABR2IUM2_9PEZI